MSEKRIDIVITENGARTVKANLDAIGQSATQSASAVDTMRQTLSVAEARFATTTARNDATLRKSLQSIENMQRAADDRSYRSAQMHGDRQVMATTMFGHREYAAAVKAGDARFQYEILAGDRRYQANLRAGDRQYAQSLMFSERLAAAQRKNLNKEVSDAAMASEKLAQNQRAFGDKQVATSTMNAEKLAQVQRKGLNAEVAAAEKAQAQVATITSKGAAQVQSIVQKAGAQTAAIQTKSITVNTNLQNESAAKIALTAARTAEVQERAALRAAKANAMVSDSFAKLKSVVAGVGGIYAANEIRKAADEYQALQNKLTALGVAQSDLASTTKRLTQIANESYASLEGTGTLYARLIPASKALGASQQDLFTFVKAASQSMAIFGTEGGTATGAMLQLSQAMSRGKVQAQEFRSLMDGMYPLLQVVANNLDAAGGSVSKLRGLMLDGKLTSRDFFNAAVKGAAELEVAAAKIIPTTAQVGTIFRNAFVVAVGQLNDSTSATRIFAVAVHALAMNINTIIGLAFAAAAAYAFWTVATINLGTATGALSVAMRALTVAVSANPITAFVTVLVGAVAYLYAFRKEMMLGTNSITKMEDLFTALGIVADRNFSKLEIGGENVSAIFKKIELPTFSEFLTQLATEIDAATTLFKQFGVAVVAIFAEIPVYLEAKFDTIFNSLKTKINEMRSGMAALINDGRQLVGLEPNVAPEMLKMTPVSQRDLQYRDNVGGAIASVAPSTGATDFVKGLLSIADSVGAQRAAAEKLQAAKDKAAADAAALLGGGGETAAPDKKAIAEANKFATTLEKLRDKYDGVYKAQSAMKEGTEVFDRAMKEGTITLEQRNQYVAQMTEELKDQADPLGAVNRELDRQSSLLQMSSKDQEIANQLYQIKHDMLKQGILLDEKALSVEEQKLRALQSENELSRERNRIMDETVGKLDAEAVHRKALAELESGSPQQKLAAEKAYLNENADLLETKTQTELRNINERRAKVELDHKAGIVSERQYATMVKNLDKQVQTVRLNQASDFFGGMSALMQSHSKKAFAIGKAAAIAQAIIQTYAGATAAFASLAETGPWGVVAGVAAAAAAIASGMANVAQIRSQQMPAYAFGGEQVVGGVGGTDSQVVAFRATPGETVRVTTPSQESSAARANGGGDTMIFNMPGITNESQARQSAAQLQRSLANAIGNSRKYR